MSTIAVGAETVQVRRISWAEFYRIRPDLKPVNDNEPYTSPNSSSFVAVGRRS